MMRFIFFIFGCRFVVVVVFSFEDLQEQNLMAFRGGALSGNRKPGPKIGMEL